MSLVISVCCLIGGPVVADEPDKREIVKQARQATVYIETNVGQGSGFFVTRDVIVTNFHVIENVRNRPWLMKYWREGQQNWLPVKSVHGYDIQRDLAILKVSLSRVSPLVLSDSGPVEPLDAIYVAGFPKQSPKVTISTGNISAIHDHHLHERLQFTAPISGGSSGGPLLNDHGEVVGVVTSTRKSEIQFNAKGIELDVPQNLNMAIPTKHLKTLLRTHKVRLPPKPKRKAANRKNEDNVNAEAEKAKADAEKAKAEARKVEAEAKIAEAEAEKAQAEAKKADAERAKAKAEKAKAESKIAEAERTKTESESTKIRKEEVAEPIALIADRLKAATVLIFGRDRNGIEELVGSGFFVREDQVATDSHVIDGSKLIKVKRVGQGAHSFDTWLDVQLLKTDRAHNLAIMQVKGADVQPLPLANSEEVDVGQKIFLVGNPVRDEFSEGKISYITELDGVRYFQFYAPVSPGSSGGPIVNAKGEVIAVTALNVGGITNAIPSNYLTELLEGEGDPLTQPTEPTTSSQGAEDDSETNPTTLYLPRRLLERAIELFEKSRFPDAIEHLELALNGLHDPVLRATAHLYLGFSKWGLAETESSVNADFREALRYNPNVVLPPRIGQNHPVFKPLLELMRRESLGTLTVNALPPETEVWLFGGEMKRRLLGVGTASIRLFKGNYAVEAVSEGAHKVVPVLIKPDGHEVINLEMPTEPPPSHEFELTLDLDSTEKPKKVVVHYTIYDVNGKQIDGKEKRMQFRERIPETSMWVFHVKLPSAPQGGKIVYRIEADGKIIREDPLQVEILEPPEGAWIEANQTIPIKARIISNVEISDVRVIYDTPTTLADASPSQKLETESTSNTYIGKIPAGRRHTDGTSWFYISATNKEGFRARSATRAVHSKTRPSHPPDIAVTKPPGVGPMAVNKPIDIEAEVKSSVPLKEVRVHYDFPRSKLSEESPSKMLRISSSDTYIGEIPRESNRTEGYIWYFVSATTSMGVTSHSEDRMVETKEPTSQKHQGLWASHSWSNLVSDEGFYSGWERGNVMSLAFLQEGKGFQTLGVQLDYTYENTDYITATAQWGPSTRENPVAFAFLAGAAGHRPSDPSFSRVRQARQFTPLLGGSFKFHPLDRVVVDATASVRLQSENGAADRESNFIEEYLHHYEAGIRLYISPTLNLKAGYGRWRLGEYDNASVQVGLGATF